MTKGISDEMVDALEFFLCILQTVYKLWWLI